MKVICDLEDLRHNYIVYSESGWTRKITKEIARCPGSELLEYVRKFSVSCHLETVNGEVIEDPQMITESLLDDIDLRLVDFIGASLMFAAAHLRNLGFASGKVSLDG